MTERERLQNIARASAWNKANKDRRKEIKHRSYLKNKAKVAVSTKRWQNANWECFSEANRRWKKENPERVVESAARRRARIRQNEHEKITPEQLSDLLAEQNGLCVYCSVDLTTVPKHLDHVIPVSRGGRHVLENLVWACERCNLRKASRTPEEWLGKNYGKENIRNGT